MPINADLGGKEYTLGRGKLYFDRFAPNFVLSASLQGEGERYFGNTPEFSSSTSSENLDHYDSDGGIKTKDDSVPLSFDRTGNITVDNISSENIALLFLSNGVGKVVQTALTAVTTTRVVARGRFYQLGATEALPSGVRNVSTVSATKGTGAGTAVTQAGNFEVDEALGRVYILPNAPGITDGDSLTFTFSAAASTREQIISGTASIYGALRYVADNPKGKNRDFYMPYVKLTPDGDYNFKGDDWNTMAFALEILKKSSITEAMYIDGRPAPVV